MYFYTYKIASINTVHTYIRRYIHCAYLHEHVITFDTNLQLFMLPKVACTLSFLLVKQEFVVLRLWVLKIYMHPCANPDAEYFKFLRFGNELCKEFCEEFCEEFCMTGEIVK